MRRIMQFAAIGMLLAAVLAAGSGRRSTAAAADDTGASLEKDIAAARAKLAELEFRRHLLTPETGEPNTHIVIGFFRETTTIKFVDRTKRAAAVVATLDGDGNLRDQSYILAADAFVFSEADSERLDWSAIKPGMKIHLYCTKDASGAYGPPVLKVGVPAFARNGGKT